MSEAYGWLLKKCEVLEARLSEAARDLDLQNRENIELRAKLEAMERELEEQRGQKERLQWAVQIVLRDFQDNHSPCLSQAGVNAIWVVEPLAVAQQEEKE